MLRVGLTGGIGSGKSTAARRLVERGAVLVDADVVAREVVAPGSAGLAEVVAAFGREVLGPDGALDRPALAALVFGDPAARATLNGIVHPRVRERTEEIVAAVREQRPDAVVVQDIPLLVETRSPADFDLVVVVHADADVRVERLVRERGMPAADARARIAAQADDTARRAAADVWLDNGGAPAALDAAVDALWRDRLSPFAANRRTGRPVIAPVGTMVGPDPGWAAAGARLGGRVARAVGSAGRGVAHVGPTAVPGLPADDVLDVLVAVEPPDVVAAGAALDAAGFPRMGAGAGPGERRHAGTDPGRPVRVHVRPPGSAPWRADLVQRDWLRADAAAREERVALAALPDAERGRALRHWAKFAVTRAEDWAASSGWTPSLDAVGPTGP